ncbi:unnamed protein product [Chilo suppressalis]|uniref:ATP-dependent RNA helicase n=1 Tax=Chilo suppressalis TaxID=168631 RepID=A0ABN8LAZ0_CHISP|nr:unnamed protein product [Chilo suppressalis]
MDLFVINRYRETPDEQDATNREAIHLEKLKKKIDERKKANLNIRKSDVGAEPDEIPFNDIDNYDLENNKIENNETDPVVNIISDETKLKPMRQVHQEFKVLGGNEFKKNPKVQRILPYWLSHPYSISRDLQTQLIPLEDQIYLHNTLKSILSSEGITHLFPVQAQVIPFILEEHKFPNCLWRHDICVSAPTGSGKTLSFVLPIVQLLMKETGHHIRAMVVLPVQELAAQIAKVFRKYCSRTGLKVALLSGSTTLHQEQQQIVRHTESFGWISEVDIIVCTAGRLVEHLQNTEGFSLKYLQFLVIDEADRIMEHIQNDWLYHMDKHIKLENEVMTGKVPSLNWDTVCQQKSLPHKLLFSATLSQDPEKLEQWGLFQPKLFSTAPKDMYEDDDHIRKYTTPAELQEQFVACETEHKPLVLYHFLVNQKWDKVLCFTNAAQTAHRLTILLNTWAKGNIKVAELSAALDKNKRDAVLKRFTQSEVNVLIGTDALARGIDIPDCNYVISYDPPRNIKTYIHRVGRTGRAGRSGCALTVLQHNQINMFKELLQTGGKSVLPQINIKPEIIEEISESYQLALHQTKSAINDEINSKVKKSIEVKRGFKARKRKLE